MDSGSDLMDWESASPPTLLKASPTNWDIPAAGDWEPELPGQFSTPLRVRRGRAAEEALRTSRKRGAFEAGFTSQGPDPEDREPVMLTQPVVADPRDGNRYIASILAAVTSTYYVIHRLFNATIYGAKATRRGVRAVTQSQRVVEIRRLTSENFVSIKRRATEAFTRPVSRTVEEIVRDRRQDAPLRPINTVAHPAEPQYDSPNLETSMHYQKGFTAHPRMMQQSSTLEAVIPHSSNPHQTPLNIINSDDAQSLASTTRQRRVPQTEILEPTASKPYESRQTSLDLTRTTNKPLVVNWTHPKEVQQSDALEDRPSQYAESMHKLLQNASSHSNADPAANMDPKELDRLLRFFTPSELPGRNRIDTPVITYELPTAKPNAQRVGISSLTHQPSAMTDKNIIPKPKNVRIALNPSNGLPQESVGRFYRDSTIGEWAASSPWNEDDIDSASLNLNANLAILTQDVGSSTQPKTPLNRRLMTYPTSIAPGEAPSYPLEPNRVFTPPDVLDHSSPILESPDSPYNLPSPCRRIMDRFTGAIEEAEIASSSQYLDLDVGKLSIMHEIVGQETIVGEYNVRVTEDAPAKTPDTSRRKSEPLPVGEEMSDIFLELAMSEGMANKICRQRRAREAKRAEAKALALKKAEEEAAAARKAQTEAEEAERQRKSQRRMPREKLIQPLNLEWEARIKEAMHKGDNVPLTTTVSGTELTRKDFMTVLGAQRWLNDEIINAYLEWVVEYANEKAGKNGRNATPKVIAHNSFFYQNLAAKGPSSVSRWMKRKKAEGKKLLDIDCVLIPVNSSSHWTLIVVSPKERTVEYLDSFGGDPKVFVSNTLAWLKTELAENWREEEWRVLETKSAQQTNSYDCGVFTVTNAECVVGGVETGAYSRHDMTEQRWRIAAVLLNRGFGGVLTPAEEL